MSNTYQQGPHTYPQGPQGLPEQANPFVQPQPPKKKHTLRNVLIGGGVLMALTIGSCSAVLAGGTTDTTGAEPTKPSAAAPAEVDKPAEKSAEKPAEEEAEPVEEESNLPAREQDFIEIVQTGIEKADEAENDLQAGRALTKRDKALKQGDFDSAKQWRGTVKTLDSNGDGDGVLVVELAPNVAVGTWNNAFSDINDNTLIKSDKMMDTLSEMSEGDEIIFSGKFITDGGMPENKGLSKIGKLQDPEFVFDFSSVKAA